MSVRKLFDKEIPESVLSSTSLEELGTEVESSGNIEQTLKAKSRFVPQKNYANPKSFARFGSAEKYYEDSFSRILNQYPYDGSLRERQEFLNESNYLDLYVLDRVYPRTTGHAIISPNGWGTLEATSSWGGSPDIIGKPSILEYIQVVGGPNSAPQEFLNDPLKDQFQYSNKYDVSLNRESNLECNFDNGVTVEFWMNKQSGSLMTGSSDIEVISHLANDNSGSILLYLDTKDSGDDARERFKIAVTTPTQVVSMTPSLTNIQILDGQWHHYAVSIQNSGSNVNFSVYYDGNLLETQSTTPFIGTAPLTEVTGALKLNIGASREMSYNLGGGLNVDFPSDGWCKLSGSIDEFRYWKATRTSEDIGRYWFTQYGGGTNTDEANTDLGVYLKFNEGITGDTEIDSVALDYSGRISNGNWTGYTEQARSTASAIDLYLSEESEFKDPIIYAEHPEYISKRAALISSGSTHDIINNTSLYNSIPSWIVEQDDQSGKELLKLTQVMSNYFDTLQLQMENYPNLKNINYPGPNTKPLPFAHKLLEGYGLSSSEIFVDATILEQILNRSETEKFDEDLTEVKNLIYQNIYNNLTYIYKSKGSMKSFRNLMRCYGIDSELVKINLYADNAIYKFEDNFQTRSIRKKYVDFDNGQRNSSNIYQHTASGNPNSVSYISGSNSPVVLNPPTTSPEYYTSFTMEAEAIFPKKLESSHPNYYYTDFVTSSIAGFHTAIPEDPTDFSWISSGSTIQIHAVRDQIESRDVSFSLIYGIGSNTASMTTDLYYDTYDNTKWNFAARVRPEKLPADLVPSAADTEYILEFYGVSTVAGQIENEFLVTSSISAVTGSRFLTDPKRVYAGANRVNFTGSAQEETDIKLGSVRFWNSYLSNSEVKTHSRDPENYGVVGAYENTYLYTTSLTGATVPKVETLSLSWAFDTLTGSNSSGEFVVQDFSSGSVEKTGDYKWLGSIVGKQHTAVGANFPLSDAGVVDTRFIYSGKQAIPENIQSSDMVFIDESDNTFKLSTRPQEYFFAIEKSMYQNISEEILNIFSTIVDFNTLIGDPVNRYRQEYKALGKLRELFFNRVQNTPDLDRYIEFYKWIDSSLTNFLLQFVPASAKFSDNMRTMVESHVLERNKYWNKFPTLEFEITDPEGALNGVNELTYDWELGHAPVNADEDTNCYWWKNRAERDGVITSGDAAVDSNRQAYLDASLSVLNRKFKTPLNLTVEKRTAIHGGSNFSQTKNTNYVKDTLKVGSSNGVFLTAENIEPHNCKDQTSETKRKLKYRTFTNTNSTNPGNETYVKGDKHLPFTIYSSSNPQGFDQEASSELGHNIRITNLHDDNYGSNYGSTLQSPFTDKFVGGLQRRHVDLNNGLDSDDSRSEGFEIAKQSGRIEVTRVDVSKPRAIYYREELAKRPVNIRNIKISGTIDPTATTQFVSGTLVSNIGNYKRDYEIIQAPGRYVNNRAWVNQGPWSLENYPLESHLTAAFGGAASTVNDQLIAYYRCADATDEKGSYNGTFSNAGVTASGKYGSGWQLTSSVDGVITTSNIQVDTTGSGYSVACWVYNINNGSTHAGQATSLITDNSVSYMPFYLGYGFSGAKKLFASTNGGAIFQPALITGSATQLVIDGSASPYLNNWTHICFTATGNTITYYINGVESATSTNAAFNDVFNFNRIGNLTSGWSGKHTFGDRMDEVAIWRKVLAASEISDIYASEIETLINSSGTGDSRENLESLVGPKIQREKNEHIFVSRFSSPGGRETMGDSNGGLGLDRYSSELSRYNSLNIRNDAVRRPLNRTTLVNHISSYNTSSHYNVNKNPRFYMSETSPGSFITSSKFDNYWVQHAIPATDLAYSWVTSSYSEVSPSGFGYWYNSQFWGSSSPVSFHISGADDYSSIPVDFAGMNNLVYEPVLEKYTTYYDSATPIIGQTPKNLPNGCYSATAATPPPQVLKSQCYEQEASNFDFKTITSYRNSSLATVPTADLFNVLTNKRNKGKIYSSWRQVRAHETNNAKFLIRNSLYQILREDTIKSQDPSDPSVYAEDQNFGFFVYEPPVDIQKIGVGWKFSTNTKDLCELDSKSSNTYTQLESSFGEVTYFSSQYLNEKVYGPAQSKILGPQENSPSKGVTSFERGCARSSTPYGIITGLYLNGTQGSKDSPVTSFVEMTYGARIYPSRGNLTRRIIRARSGYIQRFWRNSRSARTTLGGYKFNSNSQGHDVSQSAWALDTVEDFITAPIYNATTAPSGSSGELQNDYSQCFSSSQLTNAFALSCSVSNYAGYPVCSSGSTEVPSASCLLQYGMVAVKSGSSFSNSAETQENLIKQSRYFSEYAVGGAMAWDTMPNKNWIDDYVSYEASSRTSFRTDATTYTSPAATNKEFTISCWVKPQPTGSNPQQRDTIISFEDFNIGKSETAQTGSVALYLTPTGSSSKVISVEVLVHTGSGTSDFYVDSGSTIATIEDESWANITFCYQTPTSVDDSNTQQDRIRIYVDGVYSPLDPTTTGSTSILTTDQLSSSYIAASTCSVGHDATFYKTNTVLTSSAFASRVFNGLIDEMSIYNYSLYSQDPTDLTYINFLYNDGTPKDISNVPIFNAYPKFRPIAWWRFGDAEADQQGISSYSLSASECGELSYGQATSTSVSSSAITTNANQQYFGNSHYDLYKYCMADGFPVVDYMTSYISQSVGSRASYFMNYAAAAHSSSTTFHKEDIIASPIYNRKHCMPSVFSVTHHGWSPPSVTPASRSLKLPIAEIETAASEWSTNWTTPASQVVFIGAYPLGRIDECAGSALWETSRLAGIVKDGQFISQSSNPFSDTYSDHIEKLKNFNKDYTIVPEFLISSQMSKYFNDGGINAILENNSQFQIVGMSGSSAPSDSSKDSFYEIYSNSDFLEHFSMIKEDHKNFADPSTITLKCDAMMKFIPYDGFYPAERALEIASQFSKSYGSNVSYNGSDSAYENAKMRPFLAPFFRPGLMFNTIKAGVAVDYPIYTGSYDVVNYMTYESPSTGLTSSYHAVGRQSGLTSENTSSAGWDYRVPFEALVNPENYITNRTIYDIEPCPSSTLDIQARWDGSGDILYSRMMSNYLAAIPEFFLPSGDFTTLSSAPENRFATVVSGTTYSMRVKLRRTMNKERIWRTITDDNNAVTYEIPQDPRILAGSTEGLQEDFTLYSRPSAFGPPVAGTTDFGFDNSTITPTTTNASYNSSLYPSDSVMGINPSFTPPYYNGESWADIIYTPSETGRVTINEIIANSKVNYWRIDTNPNIDGVTGSVNDILGSAATQAIWSGGSSSADFNTPMSKKFANAYAMQLDASLNLFGRIGDRWVISPKFETPHYNFNNNSIRPIDSGSATLTIPVHGSESVPRGMWHQFGTMEPEKGIYLEVAEISKNWIERRGKYSSGNDYIQYGDKVDLSLYNTDNMESLSALAGFETSKKLGNTAQSLTVSEAIVAVPFIEDGGERKFFEIPREVIQNALGLDSSEISVTPVSRAANAALATNQGLQQVSAEIFDTEEQKDSAKTQAVAAAAAQAAADSVLSEREVNKPRNTLIDMVRKMKKYVFPPNMDFVKEGSAITPFAMYIFEFEYTFDQDDLSYMWQNIQPPMKNAEFIQKEAKLSHKLLANELMGGFGNGDYEPMKDRVQWMVFKVKQRANNNYYSKIHAVNLPDSSAQHEYSYNWPYDFFSLVEFAKISTKVGFGPTIQEDTDVQEVANTNTDPGLLIQEHGEND
jgi:hypothetical protein